MTITAKTGTSGKIFGSDQYPDSALRDQLDVDIDRRDILLPDDHIKRLGLHSQRLTSTPTWMPKSSSGDTRRSETGQAIGRSRCRSCTRSSRRSFWS
ncbi:MAG: hypothetical protein IPM82_30970 [Saprospiraceae bacterium]|nr:hypothetical protein [Saprospiraceae bacterium]